MFDILIYAALVLFWVAAVVVGLGVLLSPVYFWMMVRDSLTADQRARDRREAQELLSEIKAEFG